MKQKLALLCLHFKNTLVEDTEETGLENVENICLLILKQTL